MNKRIEDNILSKIIIVTWIVLLIFSMFGIGVRADSTIPATPQEGQYFELRAAKINDTGENGRQLVMELWGHDIYFKRI